MDGGTGVAFFLCLCDFVVVGLLLGSVDSLEKGKRNFLFSTVNSICGGNVQFGSGGKINLDFPDFGDSTVISSCFSHAANQCEGSFCCDKWRNLCVGYNFRLWFNVGATDG